MMVRGRSQEGVPDMGTLRPEGSLKININGTIMAEQWMLYLAYVGI